MKFVNIDNQVIDTADMKSFDMNEKAQTRKTLHYRSLIKIDMRTNERTEVKRIYKQAQLEDLQAESRRLNQQDIDREWYYTIVAGVEFID